MSHKKQIFKLNNLRNLLTEENSCVSLVPTTRLLALPPFFLNDMKSGIFYLLNNMLKKYDRSLGGIVIGYQNIKVLMDENTGIIPIGTSETEVNISVEFYIFQPKIGSYLEGVINKKSNNHIGCLVHRYFNATILKPDNVNYEDWLCKDFNVDDRIIFKVIDLDFTSLLPYIEGVVDEILLDKIKSNIYKTSGTDTSVVNNINKSSQNAVLSCKEFLKNKSTLDEESEDFLKNKKKGNNSEELSTLEGSVNKNLEVNNLFINSKSKKKKKDKGKKKLLISVDNSKSKKEKSSNEEVTSDSLVCKTSENHSNEKESHKKKEKKKKIDVSKDSQEDSEAVEKVSKKENQNDLNSSTLEKPVQVEDQNLSSFVKLHKKKKEKKKKKDENEKPLLFSPISQEVLSSKEVEDNILYSTLLEYQQPEKMRVPFCSPIPQGTPVAGIKGIKNLIQALPSVQIKSNETETKIKKKKEKKRKREENESSAFPASKKMKTSPSSSFGKGISNSELKSEQGKSESQKIAEKLYGLQLNKVKEVLSTSDKESCLEEKKKKRKSKKREKEFSGVDKNEKAQINGENSTEKKCETESLVDKIFKEELQRLKEEFSMTDRESSTGSKKTKVKMNKSGKNIPEEKMKDSSKGTQNAKVEVNGTNEEGEKSGARNVMDELLKHEMNRVKEDLRIFGTASVKETKETKEVINKQETLTGRSHDSLYEKLLKEAKSAVAFSREEPQTAPPTGDFIKKKSKKNSSDFLNSSISSSKKKNLENKKKKEIFPQTPDKYKNGSMYDLYVTPEKVNHEKSLFTDSEPSQVSPFKRLKETNGTEDKTKKSLLQNMWVEFCKERKRLKKQKKKKIKSDQKSRSSNEKEESLFEKLLKEAKSLVVSEDQCLTKKKKKKS